MKRPGTGEIRAKDYEKLLKKIILEDVKNNTQLKKCEDQLNKKGLFGLI